MGKKNKKWVWVLAAVILISIVFLFYKTGLYERRTEPPDSIEQTSLPPITGYNTINNLGIVYPGIAFKDIVFGDNNKLYYGGFPSNEIFSFSLINNQNTKIANLQDNESVQTLLFLDKTLFLGGYGGRYGEGAHLYKYSPELNQLKDLGSPSINNHITSLVGNNKFIYGATSSGKFFIFNRLTKKFFTHNLPGNGGANLVILSNGKIIGGTTSNATIFSYDPKTDKIKRHYQFDNDIAIAKLVVDMNDIIWGSTSPGNQIFNFDYKTGEVKTFTPESLKNNYFWDLVLVPDGRIFFSTSPKGLFGYFWPEKNKLAPRFFPTPFPYQPVSLAVNSGGLIAGAGFCGNSFIYNTKTGKFKKNILKLFNTKTGFPVTSLWVDSKNSLVWGGTGLNRSLFVYDIKNNLIKKFGNVLGIGNIDSLVRYRSKLYLGLYSGALLALYDLDQPFNPGNNNPKIIEEITPPASRISVLIKDDKGNIFGGTTCDRTWCGSANWFVYSKNNLIKKGVIPNEKYVTSLVKIGNYLYGGTYPHGHVFQIDLKNYTLKSIEKIGNGKNLILGTNVNNHQKVIIAGIDNKLIAKPVS